MPLSYPFFNNRHHNNQDGGADTDDDHTLTNNSIGQDSMMQSIQRHEEEYGGARPPHLPDANSVYTYNSHTDPVTSSKSFPSVRSPRMARIKAIRHSSSGFEDIQSDISIDLNDVTSLEDRKDDRALNEQKKKQEQEIKREKKKSRNVKNGNNVKSSNNSNNNNNKKDRLNSTSCCARFLREINPFYQHWFSVTDSNNRKLDISASFAPATCCAFFNKIALWIFGTFCTVYAWIDAEYKDFFMAFLTHWSLMVTIVYLCMSLFSTIFARRITQPPERVTGWVATMWAVYAVAVHAELFITILYWTLVYQPGSTIQFMSVALHGGLFIVLYIDGMLINRIPLRWSHWYGFVLPYMVLYIVWSGIHAGLDIGNPYESDNDPTTNDDAIYRPLTWTNGKWPETLGLSLACIFVASPVLYGILWMLSLYNAPCCCKWNRRRYIDAHLALGRGDALTGSNNHHHHDIEEGSIFARWTNRR